MKLQWKLLTKHASLKLFLGTYENLLTGDDAPPIDNFEQLTRNTFGDRFTVSIKDDLYEVSIENIQYNDTYTFLLDMFARGNGGGRNWDTANITIIAIKGIYIELIEMIAF